MSRPTRAGVAASADITIRVTPEVKRRWQEAAAREGQTLTAWLIGVAELELARGSMR